MNIIVFGGGTVGKFGNDFCLRARREGHNVIIFSHKSNNTDDSQQYVINYADIESCETMFKQVLSGLEKIDLILFNQVGGTYPSHDALYTVPSEKEYQYTLNTHVLIPHLFLVLANDRLSSSCKVINMTSNVGFEYDNIAVAGLVGYGSGKAFATHLIQGLARLRKNNVTYFSISPSCNYDSEEGKAKYPLWMNSLYDFILSATDEYNGEIVSAWDIKEHRKIKFRLETKN